MWPGMVVGYGPNAFWPIYGLACSHLRTKTGQSLGLQGLSVRLFQKACVEAQNYVE